MSHCPFIVPKKSQQWNTPKRLIHKGLDLFCPIVPFFVMFIYINRYMIVIYKRIEKRMEQGDKHHSNPCYYWSRICSKQGDKEGQQGDKSLF